MATTNLIVDYLIAGTGTLIWIFPLFLLPRIPEDAWCALLNLDLGFTIVALPFLYILGIAISRLADDLTDCINDIILDRAWKLPEGKSYHFYLNQIVAKSESATDYLSYRRSVIRIARASMINFLIGGIAWLFYSYSEVNGAPDMPNYWIAGGSFVISALMLRTWPLVLKGYFYNVRDIYNALVETSDTVDGSE